MSTGHLLTIEHLDLCVIKLMIIIIRLFKIAILLGIRIGLVYSKLVIICLFSHNIILCYSLLYKQRNLSFTSIILTTISLYNNVSHFL